VLLSLNLESLGLVGTLSHEWKGTVAVKNYSAPSQFVYSNR